MAAAEGSTPQVPAQLVVHPDTAHEVSVPVLDRLFVGRECAGIEQTRRLLVDDPTVSRNHFEIRLDDAQDRAYIVDTSTNGTHVNGQRIPRAVPQPLRAGDRLQIGSVHFAFRSARFSGDATVPIRGTMAQISVHPVVLVVGDITNYSTISQRTESDVVAACLQQLYEELNVVLAQHRGTLNHYAGDALYAVWEEEHILQAAELAVDFALVSNARVDEIAPSLPLRGPDGAPVKMGWAVVCGRAAITTMTHAAVSVVGDATNLAFRLSGIAGRQGRAPVIVTEAVREKVLDRFVWGEMERVPTKGRSGEEAVYPVWSRAEPRG